MSSKERHRGWPSRQPWPGGRPPPPPSSRHDLVHLLRLPTGPDLLLDEDHAVEEPDGHGPPVVDGLVEDVLVISSATSCFLISFFICSISFSSFSRRALEAALSELAAIITSEMIEKRITPGYIGNFKAYRISSSSSLVLLPS